MRQLMAADSRVAIVGQQVFQLVCFRINSSDIVESNLLTCAFAKYINDSHQMVITHANCKSAEYKDGIDVIRISISHQRSTEKEVKQSYEIISDLLETFLARCKFIIFF